MDKDNSVFRKMDAKIKEIAELEIIKDKLDKLICFSGIDITIAVKTDGGNSWFYKICNCITVLWICEGNKKDEFLRAGT